MAATKDAAARPAPAWIGTWDERAKGPQDAQQLVQPQHNRAVVLVLKKVPLSTSAYFGSQFASAQNCCYRDDHQAGYQRAKQDLTCNLTLCSVFLLTLLRLAMPSHASLNATDVTLIKAIFRKADVEQTGVLSREAFVQLLRRLDKKRWTNAAVEGLMKVIDRNTDGNVQYEEFLDWCMGGGDGSNEVVTLARLTSCKKVTPLVRKDALAFLSQPGRSALFPEFSEVLRGDRELCQVAMGELGVPLKYATDAIKDDKEVVEFLLKSNCRNFRHASERLRNDKDFALAVIQKHLTYPWSVDEIFDNVSRAVTGDFDIMLVAVQLQPTVLRYAAPHLRDNKDLVLAAVQSKRCTRHSDALGKDFSDWFPRAEFAGDRDVMLVLVKKMPLLLKQASHKLRADRQLVMVAVEGDGDALEFASEELRGDREIVSIAVEHMPPGGDVLKFASEALREDSELQLLQAQAVERHEEWLAKPTSLAETSNMDLGRTRDLLSLLEDFSQPDSPTSPS
eukprot:s2815_g8.t1